ncbi:hypothetical protein [Polluticoccus soli]|uniref:hypothetical protein n=1 Tax=Polluticoccus soli TaxID=3034150 RepID=UPI0023E21D60|nr:hypothetical protein [Flavipsychrobacter sp. JY13-12]
MKKLLVVAAGFLLITSCKKEDVNAPQVQTTYDSGFYTLPGTLAFSGNTAIKTSDNNIVICGMSDTKAQLVKLTSRGSIIWQRTFFVDPGAEITCIAELPQGGYAIAGGDNKSSFVIATNANGQKTWKNYYGGSAITIARQLATTADNHIVLAGSSYKDSTRRTVDVYLGNIQKDGTAVWEKNYTALTACYDVSVAKSGDILLTGSSVPDGYAQGTYLLKTKSNGDKLWERIPPATETSVGITSEVQPNGEIITIGTAHAGGLDAISVLKLNGDGNKVWEKELSENGSQLQASAIHLHDDGSMIIAGSIQDNGSVASTDILLVKLDAFGNKLWQKTIGGSNEDRAFNIIADNDGLLLIGNTKSYGEKKGEPNIFLLRINNTGDLIY